MPAASLVTRFCARSGTGGLAPLAALLLLTALPGCTEPERTVPGHFETTGEIIALSGGDAGPDGACVICHGLNGEGDGNLVPALAGMDPGYLARQMEFFAAGLRRDPQMRRIADRLDWSARQKVAFYYASRDAPTASRSAPEPAATPVAAGAADCPPAAMLYHHGDPERGVEACAVCHGADGLGVGAGNPALPGQPAPYLAEQLRQWREGERYGDPLGAMTRVSRLLSEQEVRLLADYSASLPDGTRYAEHLAACLRAHRPDPRSGA